MKYKVSWKELKKNEREFIGDKWEMEDCISKLKKYGYSNFKVKLLEELKKEVEE